MTDSEQINNLQTGIGWVALRGLLSVFDGLPPAAETSSAYRFGWGRVGSMATAKIVAAVTTCAEREDLVGGSYREIHALYHAIDEALLGLLRGSGLGELLRTAGLVFVVVRGPRFNSVEERSHWIAVAMFGTIGAPRRGWEHEAVGLGINHL